MCEARVRTGSSGHYTVVRLDTRLWHSDGTDGRAWHTGGTRARLVMMETIDRLQIEAPIAANLESGQLLLLEQPVNC